jgi:hypothetical protein
MTVDTSGQALELWVLGGDDPDVGRRFYLHPGANTVGTDDEADVRLSSMPESGGYRLLVADDLDTVVLTAGLNPLDHCRLPHVGDSADLRLGRTRVRVLRIEHSEAALAERAETSEDVASVAALARSDFGQASQRATAIQDAHARSIVETLLAQVLVDRGEKTRARERIDEMVADLVPRIPDLYLKARTFSALLTADSALRVLAEDRRRRLAQTLDVTLATWTEEQSRTRSSGLICGHCGTANSPQASFCKLCDEYLDWTSTRAPDVAEAPRSLKPEWIAPGQPRRLDDDDVVESIDHPPWPSAPTAPSAGSVPPSPSRPLPGSVPRQPERGRRPTRAGLSRRQALKLGLPRAADPTLRDISLGAVVFNPPAAMRQGTWQRVEVAIARSPELVTELKSALRGRGHPEVESIRTSPLMNVELVGEAFDVRAHSPAQQLVDPSTMWEYDIRARRHGQQRLMLRIAMHLPGPVAAAVAVPVLERVIRVKVDVPYSVRSFTASNWQWLIGTAIALGGGLTAWLALLR